MGAELMMTAELHPEEMLDAARAGTLSPRAAVDLNAHLARCQACRLHLKVADDFVAEFAGHNRTARSEQALVANLVRSAVAEPSAGAVSYRSTTRTSRLLRRLMLPAACVLLGGSAATAMWSVKSDRRWLPEIELLSTPHRQAPRAKVVPGRGAAASRPAAAPAPLVEPMLEPAPAPALAPAPTLESRAPSQPLPPPKARSVRHAGTGHSGGQAARAIAAAAEPVASLSETVTPPLTAGSLFAEANHYRRDGVYGKAIGLYRQLRNQFPGSREEITSRVIVGQLALAENHWNRALTEFDSYLAANPSGTLAEEALVGGASALMHLSRGDAERDAWLLLLKRHPSSMHSERARARLEALRP
jgi:TolA-binding protein